MLSIQNSILENVHPEKPEVTHATYGTYTSGNGI